MKIAHSTALLALSVSTARAFVPHFAPGAQHATATATSRTTSTIAPPPATSLSTLSHNTPASSSTRLSMSADDFSESKYTEAAWSAIASLTKAADKYQATNVEAPLLLDLLLNPSKHGSDDNGDAARRVVETALKKAGVDLKKFRSDLETYLEKQPKLQSGSGQQPVMGRTLQRVLEAARESKSVLSVS